MVHLSSGMAMNAQFSEHQIRTAANAELTLSAHVPGKHSRFLRIPINDTKVDSRQQRPSSKRDIGEHFPKVSDLNNNAGLKQGPLSVNSSPVALKGHGCVVSVPEMSYTSSRLLLDLLQGKPFDSESQSSTTSVVAKPSTNVEMHEKNSLASLKCGQKTAQCPDYSGITYQSSLLKMSHLLSSFPLLRKIFGSGEARPFTDEEINDVIKELFGHWRSRSTKNINNGPQMDLLQRSNSILTTEDHTERSHASAATGQCSTAAGRATEEKSLKDSKSSSKMKGHKEKLQIVQEVAETSTKIKEESLLVVAAVPEEYPSSTHSCGSSQEDWSNTDKDQHTVGKVVKRARLDSVKNTLHCHVPTHSKTSNPKEDSMCDQTSDNPSRTQDGAYLPALPLLQCHGTVLKNPLYDDISDSDPTMPNEEQNEFHVSTLSKYPLFEEISEGEGPGPIATREICSLPPDLSEPSLQQHCHVQDQMDNVTDVVDNKDQLDDINDNWLVIPLMISDIKFESGDKDQPDQVLVSSHFSPIQVYDTFESFKQANIAQFQKSDLAPENNTAHILQNLTDVSSDPEDSKTEDSSDYSDESEHNYLTVSRNLLTCPPASTPSNTDESDKEKESVKRKRCVTQRRRKKKGKEDVVVLDSDTDEDCSQITKEDTYYNAEKSKQSTPSSSDLTGPQYHSHGPETSESAIFRQNPSAESVIIIESDTEEDTDQDYGERASPVEDSEHETTQRSPKSLASSEMSHSMESGEPTDEEVKTQCLKKKATTKRRVLSSETDDGDDEVQDSVKAKNMLCKTSQLSKKKPHFVEKGTPSKVGPNPVIQCYTFAHGSNNRVTLSHFKQRIQKHNKTSESSETARETKKTSDSSKGHVRKDHKGRFVSKPNPFTDVTHISPVSRSKQRSVSTRLRQPNNNPSALHHPHTTTKAPSSTAKPMVVERVTREWENSFYSTRRYRKHSRETEEVTPGPSRSERVHRRRPSYQESVPPLMKRSKVEARQLTANATNRIAQGEHVGYPVGHGYKWRKSATGGSRKRRRSPPVCLDWNDDPSSSYVCYN